MSDFPKPPSPPLGSQEMLAELVDYYRKLVEYHEHAVAIAKEELNYAQALLKTHSVALGENNWHDSLSSGGSNRHGKEKYNLPLPSFAVLPDSSSSLVELELELKKSLFYQGMTTKEAIGQLLESNRGKMLHFNYIVREVFGELGTEVHASATVLVKFALLEGENQGLWHSVADSPGCYTFSLQDFPDLASSSKHKEKTAHRKYPQRSRLPYSEKLEQITLHEAVASILEEHYPKVMTAPEILAIFYPEGLEGKKRTLARQAISNALTKGSGSKGWERIKPGRYIWSAGSSY